MTCLQRDGGVIETSVSGYMAGNGREGVRGQVVSREGALVTSAALAGALQGLAGVAQPGENSTDASASEIARNALTAAGVGGVQQAATTLSEYYINRAEQYQPVVSLSGGTQVELVFLEGVSLQ
jgi:conjugal transfer pilus assembly protein TraB